MASTGPIIIAGGGIGGLAAAIGLARQSISCIVLEQAPKLGEIGAGIQLGPNAFHAFDCLGVGDHARKMAVYIDSLRLMDAMSGNDIASIPLNDEFRARFGNPYAVIHRGDLHGVFLQACLAHELVELRTSCKVVSYEQDGTSVDVILEGGERIRGSALIGADGLWSNVRAKLLDDGPPRVSGHTTYRSVIPVQEMPEAVRWNAATLWAGPKCHIVHYPLAGWKLFNLVVTCHDDAPRPVSGKAVAAQDVRMRFEHLCPLTRQIIDRGKDWRLWVLCDRDPVKQWVEGRVALLGDAAHPMLQYMAQGACMALEDAVCLAAEMAVHDGDAGKALPGYNSKRYMRTARVQLQSRLMGDLVYHPAGASADLRNEIMRAKTAKDWYEAIDWLYGSTSMAHS